MYITEADRQIQGLMRGYLKREANRRRERRAVLVMTIADGILAVILWVVWR